VHSAFIDRHQRLGAGCEEVVVKVLLTSLAVPSHLWTMVVPTARLLQSAGHDVAIATGAALTEDSGIGVPLFPITRLLTPEQVAAHPDLAREVGFFGTEKTGTRLPSPGDAVGRLFAGRLAEQAAAEMLEVTSSWRPDLVVRECTEFGGLLVAERLGIPVATLDNAPLATMRDADMLPWLNQSRVALGIAEATDLATVTDSPWVSWLAPGWLPPAAVPRDYRHYRAPLTDQDESLNPAIAGFTGDGPVVLAAFGSRPGPSLAGNTSLPSRLVEALGDLSCTAVVALGDDSAVKSWAGPQPSNVRLTGVLQQRLLLPACDLFVTHAGFGSVREALTAGVPMVSIPLEAEQPSNGRRLAELGVGITVDAATATAGSIAQACRTVLDGPTYRSATRKWQRRTLGLPGPEAMVRDLEALT
jgi:N-glycosyltransferase